MHSILILATQFKPNVGGIQTHLEDFTKFLVKHNYEARVISFKPKPISRLFQTKTASYDYEDNPNVKVTRVDYFDFGIAYMLPIRTVIELFLICNLFIHTFFFMLKNSKSVNLIHANDYVTAAVALPISKIFNKKWAMSHHSIFPYFRKSLRRYIGAFVLRDADVIFANSETVKKQLELGLGKSRPPIHVAHYWVDHNVFRPKDKMQARKELELPEYDYLVMFVGRLEVEKGIEEFVKASNISNDVRFVVVGAGPDYDFIKNNDGGNLIYLGVKNGEELVDCYNAADVCCFPSVAIEAFGRVAIEALSCGTSVIVSTTATKEIINDSVGLRTKPNAKDIYKSVQIAKRKFNKKTIRDECRKFSMENYSESNGLVILNEYKKLIGG